MMTSSPDNNVVGAGSDFHMNGHDNVREPSLGFSDTSGEEDEHEDQYQGDYSSRMEELFEDGEDDEGQEDDDDDEGFLYTGIDADESLGDYRSQLREVLGPEHEEEEEEAEVLEVERSLLHDVDNEKVDPDDPEVSPFFYVHTIHAKLDIISAARCIVRGNAFFIIQSSFTYADS